MLPGATAGRGRGGRGNGDRGDSGGGGGSGGGRTKPLSNTELRLRAVIELCFRRPLVVHNGLLDCMFLYDVFVGPLPHKLAAFATAASKVWREGIIDTKCIAEYGLAPAWSPSYLGLLYHRARLLNLQTATASREGGSTGAFPYNP